MRPSISYYIARRTLIEGSDALIDGAWPISWFRTSKGWGILPESFWPDGEDVTESAKHEPPNVDLVAKRFRLIHYQRLRTELECLYAVTSSRMCSVALEITKAWHETKDGNIPNDYDLPPTNVHSLPLLDVDFELGCFDFVNSWGEKWGRRGFGRIPFNYLSHRLVEGWTADVLGFSEPAVEPGISFRIIKGEPSKLGLTWLFELLDGDTDVMVAWAHVLQTSTFVDVEELFVRPDYRGRGLGTRLVNEIKVGAPNGLPIRFWIPWGDHSDHNSSALLKWAQRSGIEILPSGNRWAAFLGIFGNGSTNLPMLDWVPQKAASPLTVESDARGRDISEDAVEYTVGDIELPWIPEKPAVALAEITGNIQENEWEEPENWTEAKALRRAELVELKYRQGLSADELVEFEQLQLEFGDYQHDICPLPEQQ